MMNCDLTRRNFLLGTGTSAGLLAAMGLPFFPVRNRASDTGILNPLAPKQPHFAPRAKRLVVFYLPGGVSHIDCFDHKPELEKRHGEEIEKRWVSGSNFKFERCGQSGLWFSELFKQLGTCADDLCMIQSMHGDNGDHFEAALQMHTGSTTVAMPGLGAWVSYGLGTENPNLPPFMVLANHLPYGGTQVWDSNMLPACHQGMRIKPGSNPIPNLEPRGGTPALRELELAMLQNVNRLHLAERSSDNELEARIHAFDTADRMEREAPELFDFSKERKSTLDLYGIKEGDRRSFGWQCLAARRMLERGVRVVELIDAGSSSNWDSHGNMRDHIKKANYIDRPMAAFIKDLKRSGLLEDTLVVGCSEFGRTPLNKKKNEL
ncbi:MAG: DUF1501 domain-containing protein, partial [Verrucomicrobiota bacterium]